MILRVEGSAVRRELPLGRPVRLVVQSGSKLREGHPRNFPLFSAFFISVVCILLVFNYSSGGVRDFPFVYLLIEKFLMLNFHLQSSWNSFRLI